MGEVTINSSDDSSNDGSDDGSRQLGAGFNADLPDQSGTTVSVPGGQPGIVVFLKEDCPTCKQALPVINAAAAGGVTIWGIGQSAAGNGLMLDAGLIHFPLLDDSALAVSFEQDIEIVPTLLVLGADGSIEQRLEGFVRAEWQALMTEISNDALKLDWTALPEWLPGCGSLSLDPENHARLQAQASGSPLRARRVEVGASDDEFEFMFDQGFTDGLPVVPPTPERVLRMLAGTRRDAQDLVAILPPNMGEATVEKIAINAVMAGCKPDYLPVVIAAIEAMATDAFNIHGVMATTMGAAPVLVVNGPIRERIGMNMQMGALGQGNRANATIGRAVRLAVRNIGGARPGGTERSTMGNPMKFTMSFAEWEERSDWQPLHVERGFEREDSVVTVFCMTSGPTLMVDQTSRTAAQLAGSFGQCLEGLHHPRAHSAGDALIVVAPEHVDTLTRDGFDKQRIRERIQEVTSVPLRELAVDEVSGVGLAEDKIATMDEDALNRRVPKFASTDNIHIVVAGGDAGKFSAAFHGWVTGPMGSVVVSQKIDDN